MNGTEQSAAASPQRLQPASIMRAGNLLILAALAVFYLLAPGVLVVRDLADPRLRRPDGIPAVAWRMHKALTPRYARWARARVAGGRAAHLPLHDVPSTEWPMFGSVFYLAATEALQDEWERLPPARRGPAPRDYARDTIEACAELLLDPVHHTWVRTHWGADYLRRQNVFFRSMLIQGLSSRERLLHDGRHLDVLRDQVETLAAELDRSPYGLLEDYPNECYPIDVFAAIASIRRADDLLGADHAAFVSRALRAFSGTLLDQRGLIPYIAFPDQGLPGGPSRGIGNSYVLIYAPRIYPERAKDWYRLYVEHFWQETALAAGFREFPRDMPGMNWLMDPDSGPVLFGFSPSGNAYGIAAARVNGRFDHGWTLSAQVLTAAWPLPNGRWLGGRLLSSAAHAPYLGEANLLFILTRSPADGAAIVTGGHLTGIVAIGLLFYFGGGALVAVLAWRNWRRWRRNSPRPRVPVAKFQCALWLLLLAAAVGAGFLSAGLAALCLLLAQFLPRTRRSRPAEMSGTALPVPPGI